MLTYSLFLAPLLGRQLAPDPIIDRYTALSPSHAFAVQVVPSQRNGFGSSELTFYRGRTAAWKKELPYTPLNAFVDDLGNFAAYAYDGKSRFTAESSNLHILFFDPTGAIRRDLVYPRQNPPVLDATPLPTINSFFTDAACTRVYAILDEKAEGYGGPWSVQEWNCFDLRSGERTYGRKLSAEKAGFTVLASVPVPGTILTAGFEMSYGNDPNQLCIRDGEGRDRGSFVLPAPLDRSFRGAQVEARLVRESWPIEIQLTRPSTGDGLRLQVASLPQGKFSIKVVGKERPASVTPERTLRLVQKSIITLGLPAPKTALRDISQFCLLDGGRFAVLRNQAKGASIVIVDRQGKAIGSDIPLGQFVSGKLQISILEGRQLLIAKTPSFDDCVPKAWALNLKTRALANYPLPAPIYQFRPEFKQFIVGDGAGGIVISGTLLLNLDPRAKDRTVGGDHAAPQIRRYDRLGRHLWTIDPGDYDVEVLGVRAKDFVVISSMGELRILDGNGKMVKKVQCGDNIYPWRLAVSGSSAIVVTSGNSIYQFSNNGKLLRRTAAVHANGVPSGFVTSVAYDEDGTLWFGDEFGMAQISPSGVISHRIGTEPNRNQIFELGSLAVGPTGRIYAKDSRTEMIHAFSDKGKWVFSAKPSPTAGAEFAYFDRLIPLQNGGVFFGRRSLPPQLDCFDRTGKIMPEGTPLNGESHGMWTSVGYVDLRGKVSRKLERDGNGHWYRMIQDVANAPDGSAAVLDIDPSPDVKTCRVTIVSQEGRALRTFKVPRCYDVAYDGKQVLVDPDKSICAYTAQGEPLWKADLSAHASPYIADKSLYLWFGEPSVKRYELPN